MSDLEHRIPPAEAYLPKEVIVSLQSLDDPWATAIPSLIVAGISLAASLIVAYVSYRSARMAIQSNEAAQAFEAERRRAAEMANLMSKIYTLSEPNTFEIENSRQELLSRISDLRFLVYQENKNAKFIEHLDAYEGIKRGNIPSWREDFMGISKQFIEDNKLDRIGRFQNN